jgi:glucosyl-dolichyl phosphate glucuronosyltransferase
MRQGSNMSKQAIAVLWLVEHTAREMDIACAVKALASDNRGPEIVVRNMYYHAAECLERYQPAVVVHPFFYHLEGALATEDFVRAWPQATHFNLAWEQLHYQAHRKIKAPADDFARARVIHHAWGDFYRAFLEEAGVSANSIFVNGQPAYQLYREPYRRYYRNRAWLAATYGLNPDTRWVFIPENYRWAFIGSKVKYFTRIGGDAREMAALKDFSHESLKTVLRWCNQTAAEDGVTIIFRPRPAVNSTLMRDFFAEHVGTPARNLHFIKGESVREWILASDAVVSSYSTSLIEAAIAGRPVAMLEPLPFPDSLSCEWYDMVSRLRTRKDFHRLCLGADHEAPSAALRRWAEAEMLGRGDPITGLMRFVATLATGAASSASDPPPTPSGAGSPKNYFNARTHENDVFTEADVDERVSRWLSVLPTSAKVGAAPEAALAAGTSLQDSEWPRLSVVVCTYNRAELLDKCLRSLEEDLAERPHIEVIVVDNNSQDRTREVIDRYAASHSGFRYVPEAQQGLSHSRNRGCEEAVGDYLVYLDDDALVPPGYLAHVLRVLREHRPEILGGPVYPYYDGPKPGWFKDEFEVRKFAPVSGFSTTCRVSGGNFIIRRGLLMELGCFDVRFGMKGKQIGLGEERALLNAYRRRVPEDQQKVYYSLDCHILHFVPRFKMRRWYMVKRSYAAGRTMFRINRKTPDSVFWRLKSFIPDQVRMIVGGIRADGLWGGDYTKMLFETAVRVGNIAELLSYGWGPVFVPHIKVRYGRIRLWCKDHGYKDHLKRFERWLGIKW